MNTHMIHHINLGTVTRLESFEKISVVGECQHVVAYCSLFLTLAYRSLIY
jgi:hypothetical protein